MVPKRRFGPQEAAPKSWAKLGHTYVESRRSRATAIFFERAESGFTNKPSDENRSFQVAFSVGSFADFLYSSRVPVKEIVRRAKPLPFGTR